MHTSMRICISSHMCICSYTRTNESISKCVCIHIQIPVYLHIYLHTCICIHIHMHTHIHIINIHIHTHICIHIYTLSTHLYSESASERSRLLPNILGSRTSSLRPQLTTTPLLCYLRRTTTTREPSRWKTKLVDI